MIKLRIHHKFHIFIHSNFQPKKTFGADWVTDTTNRQVPGAAWSGNGGSENQLYYNHYYTRLKASFPGKPG